MPKPEGIRHDTMRICRIPRLAAAAAVLVMLPAAAAEELSNSAFQLRYDGSGVQSLRRTQDVADTDYIAAGKVLGRVLIRYRTTPNGDWREVGEMSLSGSEPGKSVSYTLGSRGRSLAQRSSASAGTGAAGLRALADGVVPLAPVRGAVAEVPLFAWQGTHGTSQWVQYTFPETTEISSMEVFWTSVPDGWRLIYADAGEWKEVVARGTYGLTAGGFTRLDFDPVSTRVVRLEATMAAEASVSLAEWRIGPPPEVATPADLQATSSFVLDGDGLDWKLTLHNPGTAAVEVGDLAVPFPFAEKTGARGDIYTKKLLRHGYVGGHDSFTYWQRSNGIGPFLVMTPAGQTKFEYYDDSGANGGGPAFTPYIHAKAAAAAAISHGANWRLPVSGLTIEPGASVSYGMRFGWAQDFAAVREVLYTQGKLDVTVAPGMVVPSDLPAMLGLRTRNPIKAIVPEYPASTRIEKLGAASGAADSHVYRVGFSRLGENMLRVEYADGRWSTLEFFVTEPLETVIKKRAAFLVSHHQHKDPSKWYLGTFGDWDQKNEILRGPEDRDGLSAWLTDANDDAGNARPAFVAAKNVFFPERREIEGLELYISKYLWGGMQMTGEEKYPFAIYGIPNFHENRASADPGRNGRAHVWRIYDYPHIVMLYLRMHQIAKFYPNMVEHLDAATYLERAYRTAVAYWTVPMEVEKWSADSVPTMNEACIPELIATLENQGKQEWADHLRKFWEGKVRRFVMDTPNLYGSEFAFDSTGFESTGAFAHYALRRDSAAFRQAVPLAKAQEFMDFQLRLNMSDRGWIEPTFYQLGSDYRGNLSYLLSYMSQMGGGAILDYGLHFASDPTDYLRLGYASTLSSWALVNSGTAESGFGYWFPSKNNDGATGGGFMPEPSGRTWIGKTIPRGAWYYSAEADVGFSGVLRIHATVLARDPLFGDFAYGGVLTKSAGSLSVIPRDGLRVRFHVIRGEQRLHLELDRDGFAPEQAVVVDDALERIAFTLENRSGTAHETTLTIAGMPPGEFTLTFDGDKVASFQGGIQATRVVLPVSAGAAGAVVIGR
jgi:hypothetical protein